VTILSLESLEHPLEQFYIQAIRQAPMARMTMEDEGHAHSSGSLRQPEHKYTSETLLGSLLMDNQQSEPDHISDDE
jgi:hypothetical protein